MPTRARRPAREKATLPPELWRNIFRQASHPEALLVVSDPFKSWIHTEIYHRMHRMHPTAQRIRLSLVLVCRSWHDIALEFLYEDIGIRSVAQIARLAQTMERSRKVVNGHGLGWWTRRLHLFEMEVPSPQADHMLVTSLAKVLQRMPNLEHYFDDGMFGPNKMPLNSNNGVAIVSSPASRGLRSLRTAHIRGRDIDHDALCMFLTSASRLEQLKLVQCKGKRSRGPPPRIRLSRLHTLTIDSPAKSSDIMTIVSAWDLPGLSTLVITGHEVHGADAVLRFHGSRLKTLVLTVVVTDPELGPSLHYCSRLQQLIISLYLEIPPKAFRCLESLVRLGIEDMEELSDQKLRQHFSTLYDRLEGFLAAFLGAGFSKLRCVVAVKTSSRELQTAMKLSPDRWHRLLPAFQKKKVRLEDGLGGSVVPPR